MNLKGRKQSQPNITYRPSMYGETEKKFKKKPYIQDKSVHWPGLKASTYQLPVTSSMASVNLLGMVNNKKYC